MELRESGVHQFPKFRAMSSAVGKANINDTGGPAAFPLRDNSRSPACYKGLRNLKVGTSPHQVRSFGSCKNLAVSARIVMAGGPSRQALSTCRKTSVIA